MIIWSYLIPYNRRWLRCSREMNRRSMPWGDNEEMRERLYDCPSSPLPKGGDQTKDTVVNETKHEGSKPHTCTHTPHQTGGNIRHPFIDKIMNVELPSNWKGLSIDRYDGTADPDEHVDIYVTQISLYTDDDAVFSWVFPTSPKGTTLSWFTHLPYYSIDNFETLVSKFNAQFIIL